MTSFESMGQSSIMDTENEYIGWSYINIQGRELVIKAIDNINSLANPRVTNIILYKFSKEIPVDYPPLEKFVIQFMNGFNTESQYSSQTKINVFHKAAEKYCNELDKALRGEPGIWSDTMDEKCKEI